MERMTANHTNAPHPPLSPVGRGEGEGDTIGCLEIDQPILNTMAAPVSPAAQPAHRP